MHDCLITQFWFYVRAVCSAEPFICGTNEDTARTSLNCKQVVSYRGSIGSELCSSPWAVSTCLSKVGWIKGRALGCEEVKEMGNAQFECEHRK